LNETDEEKYEQSKTEYEEYKKRLKDEKILYPKT